MADTTVTTIGQGGFSVASETAGAQLKSIKLNGREYLWQRDPAWWGKSAPILFPIVGSLRNGQAQTANGPTAMGRHGLARNYKHQIVSAAPDAVTYALDSTPETLEAFPFAFRLETTYRIVGPATVEHEFRVINTGTTPLPFIEGGHPAFNVPLDPAAGESFEDYEVRFAQKWTPTCPMVLDNGLMDYAAAHTPFENDDRMRMAHDIFTHDAWVFQNVPGNTAELVSTKTGHGVRCDFPGFTSLGVWSMGDAPFVALEPWLGHTTATDEDDVFEHKRDIVTLAPGQEDVRAFRLTVF